MYCRELKLSERPFAHGPAGRFFVPNAGVSTATARLQSAMTARDAVFLLTGGPGVGKTALVEYARLAIAADVTLAWADLRHSAPDQLFDMLLVSLGESAGDAGGPASWHGLLTAIQRQNEAGRQVTAVIDLASVAAPQARALLRLAHLAGTPGGQLNIVLVGPHALQKLLDLPGLIHMRQRVVHRHRVRPFSLAETAAYIRDCVAAAGGDADALLADDIAPAVQRFVGGVPRLINTLMEATLTEAGLQQRARLTTDLLSQVAQSLGWRAMNPRPAPAAATRPPARPAANPPSRPGPSALELAAERAAGQRGDKSAKILPLNAGSPSELTLSLSSPGETTRMGRAAATQSPEKPAPGADKPRSVVPEMSAADTSATGMLRLEDLDERFAETVFGEETGTFRTLAGAPKKEDA